MSALDLIVFDETTRTTGSDDDLNYLSCCCSPDLALCGTDVSDEPICEDDPVHLCVVCDDLRPVPCSRCGLGLAGPCWCGEC